MEVYIISMFGTRLDMVALFFQEFTNNCRLLCFGSRNLVTTLYNNFPDYGLIDKEFVHRPVQKCALRVTVDHMHKTSRLIVMLGNVWY